MDGKVVLQRRFHGTLDDSKIFANVLEVGNDDFRMSNRIGFVLVDCGVQGNDVDVLNFLISGDLMQQLRGIGSSSFECILDIQWLLELQALR